ncbi:hypothetical protein A0J57_04060 [Sphingobium sp. 22B]|uniref:enoyl-CoA hydratase/isomerase family protein n=1 Tax=unclassified Sphingobium TaxID=2611147 RepID=UPI000781D65A|nr:MULTISPECIES: enoyl-CoA hydratase-related protein [unclassified Sphingobium]KXU33823.1 hypothetical protein AXW74_00610 [Sphingobium sp. AM]KYC33767.1 hypothetical protein A0J57_04060 [Sphingobium sp. 22B]OAP33505.1 hypothetical protein A8O16_03280 [Sphingobium sp. 20006FA]
MTEVTDPPPFLVDRTDGVLTLTFNRPEHGNAMPPASTPDLIALLEDAQNDPAIRALVVCGKGKHFTTGGDLAVFAKGVAEGPAALQADFTIRMASVKRLVQALLAFDRPVVAAVKGGVAGAGLLFSLAADIVIGDDTAFFLFAHQRMGLNPDAGVSWLLPRVIGVRPAKMLTLTAARVEAEEAQRLGLLSRIVAADMLDEEVGKLARRLARAPQHATRTAKRLLDQAAMTTLSDQLDAENAGVIQAVGDPDFAEGVTSFIEKRPPSFPSVR